MLKKKKGKRITKFSKLSFLLKNLEKSLVNEHFNLKTIRDRQNVTCLPDLSKVGYISRNKRNFKSLEDRSPIRNRKR